jgi:hypothetical protein
VIEGKTIYEQSLVKGKDEDRAAEVSAASMVESAAAGV